jgi:DNA-binding LacI/PurR family transcriptional regulator
VTVVTALRQRIVGGEFGAGARLPRHLDLSRELRVSTNTIQRALDRLAAEGFVEARGSNGTFVTDAPPHLAHYAIVFSTSEQTSQHRFKDALAREWSRLPSREGRRYIAYYGISGDPAHVDAAETQRIRDDLKAQRLAGLFLVSAAVSYPVIQPYAGDLPVVGISETPHAGVRQFPLARNWAERAVDELARLGCRRIAIVTAGQQSPAYVQHVVDLIVQRGLETRRPWLQAAWPEEPQWARHATHLLMDRPADDRPDGMIITDDNLVEEAVGGVLDAGVKVPSELHVVAHCNFPWPAPSVVPLRRLGYDARQIVRRAVEMISAMQGGDQVNALEVPVVYEEELPLG